MNPPATSAAHSILVAEDNRVMSDVMRFNLQKAGYHVTIARNGTEAWELLQSARFDVLVTDYQMPGLTGEEVCLALRAQRPDLHLPIIFLSARGLELSVERMKMELGIETLLHKPFSPRELLEAVAKCVEKTTVPV